MTSTSSCTASATSSSGVRLSPEYTTSIPASRSACGTTLAPRSCPSRPGSRSAPGAGDPSAWCHGRRERRQVTRLPLGIVGDPDRREPDAIAHHEGGRIRDAPRGASTRSPHVDHREHEGPREARRHAGLFDAETVEPALQREVPVELVGRAHGARAPRRPVDPATGPAPGRGQAPLREMRVEGWSCCARRTGAAAGPPAGRMEAGMNARAVAGSVMGSVSPTRQSTIAEASPKRRPGWPRARSARGKAPDEGLLNRLLHGTRPVDPPELRHRVDGEPVRLRMDASTTAVRPRPACRGPALRRRRPGIRDVAEQLCEPRHFSRYPEIRDGIPAQVDPLARERLEQSRRPSGHLPVLDEAQDEADPDFCQARTPASTAVGAGRLVRVVGRPAPRSRTRRGSTGCTGWRGCPTGGVTSALHQRGV